MKIAVDTNILVYAEGLNDPVRRSHAASLLDALCFKRALFFPVQVLGEFFRVLIKKGRRTKSDAAFAVSFWSQTGELLPTTPSTFQSAVQLSSANDIDIWDAVILAAAIEAGCDILLSEDLQDGFSWGGCTVVNPFSPNPHPLMNAIGALTQRSDP